MPGVSIPIVNQRVDTPSFDAPANPFHAEPLDNTLGPAISKAGSDLMGVWQQQNQAQKALNLSDRMGKFQADFGQAKVNALNSGEQAPDMVKGLQDTADSLVNAYTSAPANKSIAPQLSLLMRDHVGREMASFPIDATDRVRQDLDFRARTQVSNAAQTVAPLYKIDGTTADPVFRDTTDPAATPGHPTGADLDAHAKALINGAYDPASRATENQFFNTQYQHQKELQRGTLVAQDHPDLIDKYIAQSPTLTGDEIITLKNIGTQTINKEIAQSGPVKATQRLAALQYQQQYIAQNGHPDLARAFHDTQFGITTNEDYKGYAGQDFEMPTPQADIDSWTKRIADVNSPEAAQQLHDDIGFAGASKILNGRFVAPLQHLAEERLKTLKTPAGQAEIDTGEALKAEYYQKDNHDRMWEMRHPGVFKQSYEQAEASYKSTVLGLQAKRPGDPSVYWEAYHKAIAAFPHPTNPAFKTAPSPTAPIAATDAEAAKVKALAKSKGLIP